MQETAAHPGLDGAKRLVQPRSDLGLTVSHRVERDDLPLWGRELVEGVREPGAPRAIPGGVGRVGSRVGDRRQMPVVGWLSRECILRMTTATTQLVERQIVGDGQQPGPHPAQTAIVGASVLPDAEQRFLQQILGDLAIGDDAQDDRQGDARVAIVERFQRGGVARGQARDQLLVVGRLVHTPFNPIPRRPLEVIHPAATAMRIVARPGIRRDPDA